MQRPWTIIAAIMLLAATAQLRAQTSQPSPQAESAWPRTVETLAAAIAGNDVRALSTILAEKVEIRAFESGPSETARMLARLEKGKLILARAYIHEPLAMAADIAAAYKNSPVVPDDVKRRMVPDDDAVMRRANATATQWLAQALSAKPGDPVAVIVFWSAVPRTEKTPGQPAADDMENAFILVKGQEVKPNQFRVVSLVYGNPLNETR